MKKEARKLVNSVCGVTRGDSFKKDLRLCGQIQAAGSSVMANISEGFVRRSNKEFTQFLFIAMSSSAEVQSHVYIALDQGYINQAQFDDIYNQATKTAKIISGLITYLRNNEKNYKLNKPKKPDKPKHGCPLRLPLWNKCLDFRDAIEENK